LGKGIADSKIDKKKVSKDVQIKRMLIAINVIPVSIVYLLELKQ